jgi:O-methyltransferase
MKKLIANLLGKLGYHIVKKSQWEGRHADIHEKEFWEIFDLCKPYTMTSVERMYSLYSSVKYVLDNDIRGSFVECGVWRGGSSLLIAKMLKNRSITDRSIYMYDTYEGMSEPTEDDKDFRGGDAKAQMNEQVDNKEMSVWCLADLEDVKKNMSISGLDPKFVHFIKGKVEDTIPSQLPEGAIALLRLDTDWYESTIHELNHLYPLVKQEGVIIIDDYGHWAGCRKAVDEYFDKIDIKPLLQRIDYTGRMMIKNKA